MRSRTSIVLLTALATAAISVGLAGIAPAASEKRAVGPLPAETLRSPLASLRDAFRLAGAKSAYAKAYRQARKAGAEVGGNLAKRKGISADRLKAATKRLRKQTQNAAATTGPVLGVPRATLDAIAACESGGDPTAVNSAGYYGKYQFSPSTWASVGGSGNPAAASEAEQDRRAAILYNRSGSSPWPVCGV